MNELIINLIKSYKSTSQSLKKRTLFLEKPWVKKTDDGLHEKFIFKSDQKLIYSINGVASIGSWDYLPEANSILVNTGKEAWLLNEYFIDDQVIILKRDGTNDLLFCLANENTLPIDNLIDYLVELRNKHLRIKELILLNGMRMQIVGGTFIESSWGFKSHKIDFFDRNYNLVQVPDGKYISADKSYTFYIKDNKIAFNTVNNLIRLADKITIEVETLFSGDKELLGHTVTSNGEDIPECRLETEDKSVLYIERSKIARIAWLKKYTTKEGQNMIIEHTIKSEINAGDKIVSFNGSDDIPDGTYKIKGRLWPITLYVKNSFIE